ncbi:MAG: aldo/keto reductase [Flavobacteriales bacterium]
MKGNLGFGCVRLSSNFTRKQALQNLEVAYDSGINHFDVAPLYGFGLAEGMLGDFAKNKRSSVTIATKFGIAPANGALKNLLLQNILRTAYRVVKKSRLKKSTVNLAAATKTATDFSIANAEQSLQKSLRELKTDYVDFLHLHEATVREANQPELIDFLEKKKKSGMIKAYGIASFSGALGDFSTLNAKHEVLQTDNSFPFPLPTQLLEGEKHRFYFSPFLHLPAVKELLKSDAALAAALSEKMGFDVKRFLTDLFLMHHIQTDPSGTVLFTSSKNDKIVDTMKSWNRAKSMPSSYYENLPEVSSILIEKLKR